MKNAIAILVPIIVLFSCSPKKEEKGSVSRYPVSNKVAIVDTLFGTPVPDPYRWLEDDTARATKGWVSSQNEVTFGYLKNIPFRDVIRKRLDELSNYARPTAPHKEGEYYYYSRNSGLQNLSVQYRKKGDDGIEEIFLDPNGWSKDGTTALQNMSFTQDGSLVACLISEGGSDWRKVVVLKTGDKSVVGDTIRDIKFSSASWHGNDGFYYSRYDHPKGDALFAKINFNTLSYHKIGTSQKEDKIIFDGNMKPQRRVGGGLTEDGRFLVIQTSVSTHGNELYILDMKDSKGKIVPVVSNFDNDHNVIANDGSTIILQTNLNAPNGKIVSFDISKPAPEHWKDIVPEADMAIQNVSNVGKNIFVNYLKDASTLVKQFDYKGKLIRNVALPGIGTANGFSGKESEKETYYTFTSFTTPTTVYKFDISKGTSTVYDQPKVDFNPADYETKQIFYTSKDGTRIPMFIVHKKGLELNGKNPTWLYAYGGFSISLTPGFTASRIVWLENGGVYAQPNLRGGGEYGEKWHDAGRLMNKQNVFDDFIAAGEYLINEKYTSNQYLAIAGGSNGGLLVGATMTQRPDLMKVALPAVGVMDMLRYHKFTVGAAWAYDYGTAEDSKEMFEYLKKYSPVHALKPGTSYPATLVTTADHDDRVLPAHSFKYAAALQESNSGNNPTLIRIETNSGHGSSNLSKALDIAADQYAFTWYNMGVIPELAK
ncbi:MAG TPA: prolyl oligopeptidase family serine peptidase [Cyclobacteriaceae bacterium]|nr:prolyl oligopeptidase family serine peptidase [Cyclobacteriaceae bacterium]